MKHPPASLSAIGAELLSEAQTRKESALPKSTELFPYLLIASRSMSMREISEWLKKKHRVDLSAAAISRALAQPRLHLERLADSICSRARYVGLVARSTPKDLLHLPDDRPSLLDELISDNTPPRSEDSANLLGEAEELRDMWARIPHEVRLLLEPLLDLDTEDDTDVDFSRSHEV
jgi:hypothetical protein